MWWEDARCSDLPVGGDQARDKLLSRRRSWEELACSLGHFLGNMELLWVNHHGLIGELKDKIPRWCPAWLLQLSAIPSELAQWVMDVNCKRFSNKNITSVAELDLKKASNVIKHRFYHQMF